MIIFNEKKYIEDILNKQTKKVSNQRDLIMLIRYYNYIGKEIDIEEVRSVCRSKLYSKYSMLNDIINDDFLIERAVMFANKRQLYVNKTVYITKSEYEKLRSINNYEKEKIMLTLLVLEKFLNKNYSRITLTDLRKLSLSMRKLTWNIRNMLIELERDGYVKVYTNRIFKVLIKDEDSEPYLEITDYNHIPSVYLKTLRDSKYYYCLLCGRRYAYPTSIKQSRKRNRQYCAKCSQIKNKSLLSSDPPNWR